MASSAQVREILRARNFRRLYSTRLLSAAADGIFQTALASYVIFSPQNATTPGKAAAAFAALLLPYSIAGPFVGVFLDRWRRQRVLVIANTVKVALVLVVAGLVLANSDGAAFLATAVVALGVNRFFLSALSAALPHVVDPQDLVTANALSTTSGSVMTIVGAAVGAGIRLGTGSSPAAVASIVVLGAVAYGASATVAATIGADLLGPDADERVSSGPRSPWRAVTTMTRELTDAARYVGRRKGAANALGAISAHRFLFGVASLTIVLLSRNYFATQGNVDGGILGLGASIAALGVGIVVAALITPAATDRFGTTTWITAMLILAGVAIAAFGLPFQRGLLVVGSFLLGVSAQGVKICVDSTVQQQVDDVYRGRVFSVYDMAFNGTYVAAAAVAATVLPKSGKSFTVMALLAGGYLLAAMIFAWSSARTRIPPSAAPTPAASVPGAPRQPVGIETGKSSSGGYRRP
ncbi:MAG TPA: MFS transporter [Acidothermaceae bacterium]